MKPVVIAVAITGSVPRKADYRIGPHQSAVIEWVLQRNGDAVRTGLEDNVRIDRDRLASSNAELVRIAADLCGKYDARPATAAEARQLLGLAAQS